MNEITTVGADIAKEVIVVCAADAAGRAVYFKQFSFDHRLRLLQDAISQRL